jgi:hypothetical protein
MDAWQKNGGQKNVSLILLLPKTYFCQNIFLPKKVSAQICLGTKIVQFF